MSKKIKENYILLLLFISTTTFEYFFRSPLFIPIIFVYSWYIYKKRNEKINKKISSVFLFALLPFLHFLVWNDITFYGILRDVFIIISSIFIATSVRYDFEKYFVNIVYTISLISLLIYFLSYNRDVYRFMIDVISPNFISMNVEDAVQKGGGINILIYNFQIDYKGTDFLKRNCGPFWEPGMFAAFLVIALFFNLMNEKRLYSVRNLVLLMSIITTFSTTGYISLFVILLYYLLINKSLVNILLIILLSFSFPYIYELDFISKKIEQQSLSAKYDDENRFGAIQAHMKLVEKSPLIGGYPIKYVVKNDYGTIANGDAQVFSQYGLLLGLYYWFLLFVSSLSYRYSYGQIKNGLLFFSLLVIIGFSQTVNTSMLYWIIIILGMLDIKINKYG